jgi:predicted transcriptional regulator YheO
MSISVTPVRIRRIRKSMVTLGNAGEIVVHVIKAIAGNDIANSINGSRLTTDTLQTLAMARIRQALEAKYAQQQQTVHYR